MSPYLRSLALCLAFLCAPNFQTSRVAAAEQGPGRDNKASAKPAEEKEKQEAKDEKKDEKKDEDKVSRTHHSVTIDGEKIEYTATAGTLSLRKEKDGKFEPMARVFFVAYTKEGVAHSEERPVTFAFNGGPGSSSVWLHLGALGPRRVLLDEDGQALPPPPRLVDNEYSLLDKTDLVFIDPVSTGYSRPVPGENPQQFHGVQQDISSVGEFIRLYATRNKRWTSPKFLIGESYGTTRAAGLSGFLEKEEGMYLNGVMLVSAVLNFQTIDFSPGNDLAYVMFLPSYTAAAWFHGRLAKPLQDQPLEAVLGQAEAFARGDYAAALLQGDRLAPDVRDRVRDRVAELTGLTPEYVEQAHLRIRSSRFFKELLRGTGRTIGRYDSRYLGIDRDEAGEHAEFDPSYAAVLGTFTATFNQYVRDELEFESDLPYEILTGRVQPWDFGNFKNRYVDVAETLRQAITWNPFLKVFVANGFYDLATPYLGTIYTFDHLGLDPSLRGNISMGFYKAGHMMYLRRSSLRQLKADLGRFIDGAVARK